MTHVDIDSDTTATIESERYGNIFVPSDCVGGFEEMNDTWSLDLDDYEQVRDFVVGGHQIVQNYEDKKNSIDNQVHIKCLSCDFSVSVSSRREPAIYGYLKKISCDEIPTERFK